MNPNEIWPAQHDSNVRPTPLEALKMRLNNSKNNGISLARSGVAKTPRTLMLGGIAWILDGIGRRLYGQMSNLSG
jgi:hypothetical protein